MLFHQIAAKSGKQARSATSNVIYILSVSLICAWYLHHFLILFYFTVFAEQLGLQIPLGTGGSRDLKICMDANAGYSDTIRTEASKRSFLFAVMCNGDLRGCTKERWTKMCTFKRVVLFLAACVKFFSNEQSTSFMYHSN